MISFLRKDHFYKKIVLVYLRRVVYICNVVRNNFRKVRERVFMAKGECNGIKDLKGLVDAIISYPGGQELLEDEFGKGQPITTEKLEELLEEISGEGENV